jgi:catechol 2,3-dioxygenase-like lactoylglutathione lyase family enzyme
VLTKIDHCSMSVTDLMLAEQFYGRILCDVLGGELLDRKYLSTDSLILASESRGGRFDPAQSRVRVGDIEIALFLRHRHVPMPPPEQLRGSPRLALEVTPEEMDRLRAALGERRVPYEGPVEHPADCPLERSLYFRDPFGNFLEACCPRP